eukprot:TRINITY_DN1546_c0_g1_i1.p1 TRINITY_DN1546_c0_g1~~TRINITY_DN1546_c0_g1_i1.p1  ORF type:complete len:638 (+),score=91.21 TRINITY_DN1546_c0_g1_i1:146-2059(+)
MALHRLNTANQYQRFFSDWAITLEPPNIDFDMQMRVDPAVLPNVFLKDRPAKATGNLVPTPMEAEYIRIALLDITAAAAPPKERSIYANQGRFLGNFFQLVRWDAGRQTFASHWKFATDSDRQDGIIPDTAVSFLGYLRLAVEWDWGKTPDSDSLDSHKDGLKLLWKLVKAARHEFSKCAACGPVYGILGMFNEPIVALRIFRLEPSAGRLSLHAYPDLIFNANIMGEVCRALSKVAGLQRQIIDQAYAHMEHDEANDIELPLGRGYLYYGVTTAITLQLASYAADDKILPALDNDIAALRHLYTIGEQIVGLICKRNVRVYRAVVTNRKTGGKDNVLCVLKCAPPSARPELRFYEESARHGSPDVRQHCVVLHEVVSSERTYCLFLEELSPITSVLEILDFLRQCLTFLAGVHAMRMSHGDVKVSNLGLTGSTVKFFDFDSSFCCGEPVVSASALEVLAKEFARLGIHGQRTIADTDILVDIPMLATTVETLHSPADESVKQLLQSMKVSVSTARVVFPTATQCLEQLARIEASQQLSEKIQAEKKKKRIAESEASAELSRKHAKTKKPACPTCGQKADVSCAAFDCAACDLPDCLDDMICCDEKECGRWYHVQCAAVAGGHAVGDDWYCPTHNVH